MLRASTRVLRGVRSVKISMVSLAAAVSLVAGILVVTAGAADATPAWSITPSPNPVGAANSSLSGVSCTSVVSCFAVGAGSNGDDSKSGALVEHWNGTAWSAMTAPRLARSDLNAVSCPLAGNCFAVGSVGAKALVERWDGHRWSTLASPNPNGAAFSSLHGVSCPTRTSCLAVGASSTSTNGKTLVEHWDGRRWSIIPSPSPNPARYPSLAGVSCPTTTNCFVVGTVGGSRSLVEHWNAGRWSVLPSPNTTGQLENYLFNVSCPNTQTCFAAGDGQTSYSQTGLGASPLLDRWDGTRWSRVTVPSPSPYATILSSVSCSSTTNCVAAGYSGLIEAGARNVQTLIEQWDGTNWSIVSSPNPSGTDTASLSGLTCLTNGDCFAVGSYDGCTTNCAAEIPTYTLAERYA